MPVRHIDGLTGQEFANENAYLEHVSPVTGYKPTDLKHHGVRGLQIAKAALARVAKLTKTQETAIDAEIDEVQSNGTDHKLMLARRDRAEARNIKPETA